jgi:hypothetical protein
VYVACNEMGNGDLKSVDSPSTAEEAPQQQPQEENQQQLLEEQ